MDDYDPDLFPERLRLHRTRAELLRSSYRAGWWVHEGGDYMAALTALRQAGEAGGLAPAEAHELVVQALATGIRHARLGVERG